MHYVGVDIAKRSHYAAAHDEDGATVVRPFPFDNTSQGFAKLLLTLGQAGISHDDCRIGMEATGHYWIALYDFLVSHGFDAVVINPIHTDAFRKVDTVRLTKTDPIDANLIAELLRVRRFTSSYLTDEPTDSLKQLTRYRLGLVGQCTMLKNKTTAVLDRVFPEYPELFADPFGPTSRAVLKRCATPAQVRHVGVTRLARLIDGASLGRCGRAKAEAIMDAARDSIGVAFSAEAMALEVRMMVEQMEFIDAQVKCLDAEIAELLEGSQGRWLLSIPGIGPTLAAQMTAEIGDAHRFSSAKKLIAYAGLDATKYQSGERDDNGHMSKRGSSQLRYALIQGAEGARRLDAYFGEYFAMKQSQGSPYYRSLTCVARKLAGVVLALMKEERPYQPAPPEHHLPGHCGAA